MIRAALEHAVQLLHGDPGAEAGHQKGGIILRLVASTTIAAAGLAAGNRTPGRKSLELKERTMIDVNELRKGVTFELDGGLYKVLEYSHNKTGRGQRIHQGEGPQPA